MDSKQNIVAACSALLMHKSELLIATTFAKAALLGAVVGSVLAAGVLFVHAADSSNAVSIDNFTFTPKALTVKAGTSVTWTNHDDIPHGIASSDNAFKRSAALDTDDSYSFTFTAPGTYQYLLHTPSHGGHDRRRSGDGQQRSAVMLESATAKWFDLILGSQQPRRRRTGRVRPKNRARCAAIHRSARNRTP